MGAAGLHFFWERTLIPEKADGYGPESMASPNSTNNCSIRWRVQS